MRARTHEALIELPAGPVYEGLAGQTRTERVHLRVPDGSWRLVELFTSVNAATHPEIAARALAGELHRLDDGRELALSFVYHDPALRKLVVVVPQALAHLELQAWAKVMAEIAADTAHPVPAYARLATSALGLAALHAALAAEGIEPSDAELEEVALRAGAPEAAALGEWQEVGAGEASSIPVPDAAGPPLLDVDESDVESVPPGRDR